MNVGEAFDGDPLPSPQAPDSDICSVLVLMYNYTCDHAQVINVTKSKQKYCVPGWDVPVTLWTTQICLLLSLGYCFLFNVVTLLQSCNIIKLTRGEVPLHDTIASSVTFVHWNVWRRAYIIFCAVGSCFLVGLYLTDVQENWTNYYRQDGARQAAWACAATACFALVFHASLFGGHAGRMMRSVKRAAHIVTPLEDFLSTFIFVIAVLVLCFANLALKMNPTGQLHGASLTDLFILDVSKENVFEILKDSKLLIFFSRLCSFSGILFCIGFGILSFNNILHDRRKRLQGVKSAPLQETKDEAPLIGTKDDAPLLEAPEPLLEAEGLKLSMSTSRLIHITTLTPTRCNSIPVFAFQLLSISFAIFGSYLTLMVPDADNEALQGCGCYICFSPSEINLNFAVRLPIIVIPFIVCVSYIVYMIVSGKVIKRQHDTVSSAVANMRFWPKRFFNVGVGLAASALIQLHLDEHESRYFKDQDIYLWAVLVSVIGFSLLIGAALFPGGFHFRWVAVRLNLPFHRIIDTIHGLCAVFGLMTTASVSFYYTFATSYSKLSAALLVVLTVGMVTFFFFIIGMYRNMLKTTQALDKSEESRQERVEVEDALEGDVLISARGLRDDPPPTGTLDETVFPFMSEATTLVIVVIVDLLATLLRHEHKIPWLPFDHFNRCVAPSSEL